jgi:hypothetical protein
VAWTRRQLTFASDFDDTWQQKTPPDGNSIRRRQIRVELNRWHSFGSDYLAAVLAAGFAGAALLGPGSAIGFSPAMATGPAGLISSGLSSL